jgi:Transposase DDE domain group 1
MGEVAMRHGILGFEYRHDRSETGSTAVAGLLPYLELACVIRLGESIEKYVSVCSEKQGWTDAQMVLSLLLLNLAGGAYVDDLRILERDPGFGRVWRQLEAYGLSALEREALTSRFRKGRVRNLPSASAVFRFLARFHDEQQESQRVQGCAFIPSPTQGLEGLYRVNQNLLSFLQRRRPHQVATLDMDATLVETSKRDALWCYKGFRAYQPFNVYWAEQDALLYSEFRDGNVPAGYAQLRVLQEALEHLPAGVEKVRMRSDTAGYQHELLRWCASGKSERFGVIEFAVGCDVTQEFRRAVAQIDEKEWQPLYEEVDDQRIATGREWARVPFYVPIDTARSKSDPEYWYLATREALKQQPLAGVQEQLDLPFQTMGMLTGGRPVYYKIFGTVTNISWSGERVIRWLNLRCGKSEEVHSVQKEDLAGGVLPSTAFGENAAWWAIMVLAFNLNAIMKHLVLGDAWVKKRMKALRFGLIQMAGVLVQHAGTLFVKLRIPKKEFDQLLNIRRKIVSLRPV